MEQTISNILTEANFANTAGRELGTQTLGISTSVQSSLAALWNKSPFMCVDEEIKTRCINTHSGYQIRNIPLTLKSHGVDDVNFQEAVFNFNKQGDFISFYFSIDKKLYMEVVQDNTDATDLRCRQFILDYVEKLNTSYYQKDISFMEDVFNEGWIYVNNLKTNDKSKKGKIQYTNEKPRFIKDLRSAFKHDKNIHVTFDEIEIMRHSFYPEIYGVTLHQSCTSNRYHGDGYIFLLWDFRDENAPQIHVRTWQPDAYNSDGKGTKRIPKDEIFSLSDFDI